MASALTEPVISPASQKTSRNWQFTINCYDPEVVEYLEGLCEKEYLRGIIFQEEEAPTTKHPHLQGFIRFNRGKSFTDVKNILLHETTRPHIEPAHHPSSLVEYCRKEDTSCGYRFEYGDLEFEQGKSGVTDDVLDAIQHGANAHAIAVNFPRFFLFHHRGVNALVDEISPTPNSLRHVEVFIHYGESGSGKTWDALYTPEQLPRDSVYIIDKGHLSGSGFVWFNRYREETVLVIDEYKYGWIDYGYFLRLLDKFAIGLSRRDGSTVYAKWTTVFITSCRHPRHWYPRVGLDFQLVRRVARCYHYLGRGNRVEEILRVEPPMES